MWVGITEKCLVWFEVKPDDPGSRERFNPDPFVIPLERLSYPRNKFAFDTLAFYRWNENLHFERVFLRDDR